jgi:uncharacterized circularly permuted ATP-grasp superfamily protein/uncharacterized alpha-E superfamily protein
MSESLTAPASSANLFGQYRCSPEVYDESAAGIGEPRPHWQSFIRSFERLGRDELAARLENGRRMIREHGVTYNVYGDPQGRDRPWELDLVPLLLPAEEWRGIETGLVQRARLFNLILADLYGPQQLLRQGFLPPALVFGNPGFLRPCHGIRVPNNLFLHLHAADLARSPDGQWWVLADRTQAPSGAGYALENRIVLSRILPDQFRDCHVERLASFFSLQRATLSSLTPRPCENPNVVLLTPGPHNETYFEHAYLARYLGFTLVEGGDLTVRNRHVFIKTLEGLQQIDVILRRVDDSFCDPLELRGDSFLGVPGLVEAARAGHVAIANALGSGLIESPSFSAFLPSLCRQLLGEELKLPSVATWWCGQAKEQQYVLDHLDEIVIKPAFSHARPPVFGARLNATERADLVAAIRARPFDFVGQEQVALSTAPVWANTQLEPRRVLVRAYLAASGDSFTVMPGGLTRASMAAADPVVSMQSGGGSKDTWVLSERPVSSISLLTASGQPVSVAQIGADVPSRVADNLFWLGRYVERLEHTLRLLRCVIVRLEDEASDETSPELAALVQIFVRLGRLPERFAGRVRLKELEQEILQMVYHPERPGSVRELMARIRNLVSRVRDRFSADTWRILSQIQLDSRSRPGRIPLANALALLNTLVTDLAAFSGMEMENMTRGHGWRFLDFGRRLERGANLVNLLSAAFYPGAERQPALDPLLEIADSSMTYRRRYFAQARLAPLLELLLGDSGNPRSLAFQLEALTAHATKLPQEPAGSGPVEPTTLAGLVQALSVADLRSLGQEIGNTDALPAWLDQMGAGLSSLSDEVTHLYFTLSVARLS